MRDGKNNGRNVFSGAWARDIALSVPSAALALLFCAAVLWLLDPSGAGREIRTVLFPFRADRDAAARLSRTVGILTGSVPVVMCALSVLFVRRAGMLNIGAAGQYALGGGAALYLATVLGMPWWAALAASVLAGGVWGAAAGLLKARYRVDAVLSGAVMNCIASAAVGAVLAPAAGPGGAVPSAIPALRLGSLFGQEWTITPGIPAALLTALGVGLFLSRTRFGHEIRAVGIDGGRGLYCGMREKRVLVLSAFIGGALAGMGASMACLADPSRMRLSDGSALYAAACGLTAAFMGGQGAAGASLAAVLLGYISDGIGEASRAGRFASVPAFREVFTVCLCGTLLLLRTVLSGIIAGRRAERARREPYRSGGGIQKTKDVQ